MTDDAAELRELIRQQERQRRQAAANFVAAVKAGNVEALPHTVARVDDAMIWPRAIRQVARLPAASPEIRAAFLTIWVEHGDSIRQEAGSDRVLAAALRVLLPPYDGPTVTLYRGDSAWNRKRRAYGPSWTTDRVVAESFANFIRDRAEGGAVLLRTIAQPEAIISAPHLAGGKRNESEYVVDRRRLCRVELLARFSPS